MTCALSPEGLASHVPVMEEVQRRIEAAHFTGRGDMQTVKDMYAAFRVQAHGHAGDESSASAAKRDMP